MKSRILKRAALITGLDALLILFIALVLAAVRQPDGSHLFFKSHILQVYWYLHAPLVPLVQWAVFQRYHQDPTTWKEAELVVPLAIHCAALVNTFLLSSLILQFLSQRKKKRAPRLSMAQRYALRSWAQGRGTYPFREEASFGWRRKKMEEDLQALQALLAKGDADRDSLVIARLHALKHLPHCGGSGELLLALGEATMLLASGASLEMDKEAVSLGRRLLEQAHLAGSMEQRLWLQMLRWGTEDPDFEVKAFGKMQQLAFKHPQLLLWQATRAMTEAPAAQLELLKAQLPYLPASMAKRAEILMAMGSAQEAADLRGELLKARPLDPEVWRSVFRSLPDDEAEHERWMALCGLPLKADAAATGRWLYGDLEPQASPAPAWLGAGAIGLLALLYLYPKAAVFVADRGVRKEVPGSWTLAALVRIDDSRMPWSEAMPPWIVSYEQNEADNYEEYTAITEEVRLELQPDGQASLSMGPVRPLTWKVDHGHVILQGQEDWVAWASPQPDGLLVQLPGRAMRLLFQRKGVPPLPLLYADWAKPTPMFILGRQTLMRHRSGYLTGLMPGSYTGARSYGYNRVTNTVSTASYAVPGVEALQDQLNFIEDVTELTADKWPSSALLFP